MPHGHRHVNEKEILTFSEKKVCVIKLYVNVRVYIAWSFNIRRKRPMQKKSH